MAPECFMYHIVPCSLRKNGNHRFHVNEKPWAGNVLVIASIIYQCALYSASKFDSFAVDCRVQHAYTTNLLLVFASSKDYVSIPSTFNSNSKAFLSGAFKI